MFLCFLVLFFFFSSRRRHTRSLRDWSSDVCSSDLSRNSQRRRVAFERSWSNAFAIAIKPLQSQIMRQPQARTQAKNQARNQRSEERRVGKECRSRWWRYH